MNLWNPFDRCGYWLATWWSPARQVRTGVVITIAAIGLLLYMPFSGEPPLIYAMSAFALILGGLGVIETAVLAVKEDPDSSEEDLAPDEPGEVGL